MMKQKNIFNLFLMILVAFLITGCGKAITDSKDENNGNTSSESQSIEIVEALLSENEKYFVTNYVDSYNKFLFMYPTYYSGNIFTSFNVTNLVKDNDVVINTLQGKMVIHYPAEKNTINEQYNYTGLYDNARDFYNNYYSTLISGNPVQYLSYDGYKKCDNCVLNESNHVGSYDYNNLHWERYNYVLANSETEEKYDLWITIKDKVPYVIRFEILGSDENPFNETSISNSEWEEIVSNSNAIREYIIQNVKYVDNKQELLNYKEASVIECDTSSEYSTIFPSDSNSNIRVNVPNCRTNYTSYRNSFAGKVYANDNNVSINDIYNNIPQQDILRSKISEGKTLELVETEQAYIISNLSVGNYEVKKYKVKIDGNIHSMYVFKTDSIYGFIMNKNYDNYDVLNDRISTNEIDFAIKNLRIYEFLNSSNWSIDDVK